MAKGQGNTEEKPDAPENQEAKDQGVGQKAQHPDPEGLSSPRGSEAVPEVMGFDGPHRDRGRIVTRGDHGTYTNTAFLADADLRVAEERAEAMANAPLDERDALERVGLKEATERGYVGHSPTGPGENDAPWAIKGGE
jgi:hypothetical protein